MAKQKNKIIVYSNETCPYCKSIKELLEKENVKFEERLTKDFTEEFKYITYLTGLPNVPVVQFNDEYWCPGRDFGAPHHVIDKINNHVEFDIPESRMMMEKLKTLNFQIHNAFMRTDQILKNIESSVKQSEDILKSETKTEEDVDKSTD
tara:strand:+ start:313 stop:759 length:447 start_codon:yes stop_codon:yes gene_type:complete